MGRRSGIEGFVGAMVRANARAVRQAQVDRNRTIRLHARQERMQEQYRRAIEREQVAIQKQSERDRKALEKEEKENYLLRRQAEAEELALEAEERVQELASILSATLGVDDRIEFKSLLISESLPAYSVPVELRSKISEPKESDFVSKIRPRSFMERTLGMKKRFEYEVAQAKGLYQSAKQEYESNLARRRLQIDDHKKQHEAEKAAFQVKCAQRRAEVEALESAYGIGEPETIAIYVDMVLERSVYPDGFPDTHRVIYSQGSRQLLVELDLPEVKVVPESAEFRYVRSRDEIDEKARKPAEIASIYRSVVAQIALRTIHEVFESDQGSHIDLCVFNGFVTRVDPSTGHEVRPCVLSVRAEKQAFLQVNLSRVEPAQCLRNLGAQVSPRPEEAIAVKPVVEFNMLDPRFIEQGDVLSALDQRPNLMDLTPSEFETLVSNLFGKMGLETKLTRSSKDGGVDAVAYDRRPVPGGKVVIQAKRYKNTVGVSAVRDLYGTMMNEGASKGILVTTSGYGPDAFRFSEGKPVELIDGGGLLYLLQEAGIAARIVMPDEWAGV